MKKIFLTTLVALSTLSCDRFLDIEPKGQVIARAVEDYDLLLNGGSFSVHTLQNDNVLALTADDFNYTPQGVVDTSNPDDVDFQLYSYGAYRFSNPAVPELSWNNAYSNIYIFNKVINEVLTADASVGYTDNDKKRIQAEAYFGRAVDYLYLVNTYAKHYSTENANSPAVPIITEADVTQTIGGRNTVKEVYDLILSDLTAAIPYLPEVASNRTRPTKGSGNALLARVYLYMGNYQKALEYSDKALAIKGTLSDYTTTAVAAAYGEEQYSYRYFAAAGGYPSALSADIKATMDLVNDTRYSKFYAYFPGYGEFKMVFLWQNQLPSVGEMYATRAEANARLNNVSDAINDLNTLRSKRILNYTALASQDFASQSDLVKFTLEERRREVFLSHTRLFDLKRQNLETAYAKTVVHHYEGVDYTAEPNSNKLVLPIPASVLKFNPNWAQN